MNRAVLVVVALAGCNASSATPPPAPQPVTPRDAAVDDRGLPPGGSAADRRRGLIDADVSRLAGKPLYAALCAPCHGVDAKGYAADRAPSLVNPTFLESATDDMLQRSIAAGRPGTSMAAYSKAFGGPLDDAGIARLTSYLRELGPAAVPLAAGSPGDLAVGSALYAKYCFTCHGDAKTRGEAVSLANPQFQAVASDAFVRHAIVNGRPGTKMAAFGTVLTAAELDGTVSYVRALGNAGPPPVTLLPPPTGHEPLVLNPGGAAPSFTPRAEPCPPGVPGCKPEPRFVSVEQVAQAVAARRRLVIIDARPASDWRRMHAAGAVSIPYHELARLAEVPKDGTWIVAYCACPHHLSGIVVDELRKRGYAHAVVLDEGINEWQRRGLPVVVADGVPPPLPEPTPGGASR